jgi:hypothetical protein
MILHGRIENGIVVFNDPVALPNGAEVTVFVPAPELPSVPDATRSQFPRVSSKHPGSRQLTGDDVAALLSQDDVSP